MADEFQTSGNWWDSSRAASRFEAAAAAAAAAGTASPPQPSALSSLGIGGGFGWSAAENNMVDMKSRASMDSASVSGSSPMAFHDGQKLQPSDNSGGADANLHMMGLGLSNSQTMDWNHALFRGEKAAAEGGFRAILQDGMAGPNPAGAFQQQDHQIQWREKLFHGHDHSSSTTTTNSRGFSLDQSQFSPQYSSGDSTVTCQGLAAAAAAPPGFQVDSAVLYGSPSAILQGLFGPDGTQQQQPYNSAANYGLSSNEMLGSNSWSSGNTSTVSANKLPQFLRSADSPPKPSPPPFSSANSHLQFSNNAPFWNAPEAAMKDVRAAGFFPALQPQFPATNFDEKPKNISEVRDSGSVAKKSGNEAASNKRPRNDQTPSTLPAFKVRKEKMGDRITALQQLVSPFGKTDTASVLSEAIEYIKFLHEQVTVLSTPYMKSGAAIQHHQNSEKSKDPEDPKQDLRSRGLCLVPVSSTFPVTHETTVDFWTPTFGGTFR